MLYIFAANVFSSSLHYDVHHFGPKATCHLTDFVVDVVQTPTGGKHLLREPLPIRWVVCFPTGLVSNPS